VSEPARALLERCAATILLATRSRVVRLGEGCIPALVDFTFEDKAAKGLRAAPTGPRVVQHFTALELAAEAPRLVLLGERGAGKTVFARRLALHLAGERLGDARWNLASLAGPVSRGDDGPPIPEAWAGAAPMPVLLSARDTPDLASIEAALPMDDALLILDDAEALAHGVLAALAARHPRLRILALAEAETGGGWVLPPGFRRHALIPPLPRQRAAWRARCGSAATALPAHPGLLSLALALDAQDAHDLPARWIGAQPGLDVAALAAAAAGPRWHPPAALDEGTAAMLDRDFLRDHLAAQHLATRSPADAAALFRAAPAAWRAPLRLLAAKPGLAAALLVGGDDAGALLAAEMQDAPADALRAALLRAIERDALPIPDRVRAGRHLARLGDPRDLEELVAMRAGRLHMGSGTHPNSAPPHEVAVAAFRIGRYPVTNALYRRFIAATGRAWRSTDGLLPERANAPAVDLTWHDARACCAWLTTTWRSEGRIGADEIVRLPTEPEWEWAARGAQPDTGTAMVYPWAGPWTPASCNGEEAGINDTTAVGLFPAGRASCGAEDMAGQVWEWCSTLWGADMAAPSFAYPYAEDGREDPAAGPRIRRVLRGGCFSSGREKTTCTYRGSLEPDGFWRGNGFRIVVAGVS
jgi:iron(II)-dependent oxidoreductase